MFDFIIDSIHTIIKNGFTLTSAGAILFLLLKQRKMKRQLKKFLPFMFADEEANPVYVQNQLIIMKALGVEPWDGQELPKSPIQTNLKKSSISLWGEMKMKNKFKSRKFILAVVSAVLIVLNDGLDLGINSETVIAFAGIVAVWITGESVVDAKRAKTTTEDGSNQYH